MGGQNVDYRKKWLISTTVDDVVYEEEASVLEYGLSEQTQFHLAQVVGAEILNKRYGLSVAPSDVVPSKLSPNGE